MISDARCNFGVYILLIHYVVTLDSPTSMIEITTGSATITTSNDNSNPSTVTGQEI